MAAHHGARGELDARRVVARYAVVEVSEGPVGRRDADPVGDARDDFVAGALGGDGRDPELPIRLRVRVARVQRHAVLQLYARVEVALHVVDVLGHEVVVEAQQRVGVQVVQQTGRVGGAVRQGRVWECRVVVDAESLPLVDVRSCRAQVLGCVVCVAGDVGDVSHGAQSNDTFNRQVGLVG